MKKILIPAFLLLFFSCNDKYDLDHYPQKWQLTRMYGQLPGVGTNITITELGMKEHFLLNSDGTFIKSREKDGILTEATGTFAWKDSSTDGKYLELIYESKNPLIESCSGLKEPYYLRSDKSLVGSWNACDGPGLEFERSFDF